MLKLEIGMFNKRCARGFTLVEVLLALLVVAIALSAMLKITAQDIQYTHRIKQKSIAHAVAMQAIALIQLHEVQLPFGEVRTYGLRWLGQSWYWQAKMTSIAIPFVQQVIVTVSPKPTGPFTDPLIAYRYVPPDVQHARSFSPHF